jgi:hypothetical protein
MVDYVCLCCEHHLLILTGELGDRGVHCNAAIGPGHALSKSCTYICVVHFVPRGALREACCLEKQYGVRGAEHPLLSMWQAPAENNGSACPDICNTGTPRALFMSQKLLFLTLCCIAQGRGQPHHLVRSDHL